MAEASERKILWEYDRRHFSFLMPLTMTSTHFEVTGESASYCVEGEHKIALGLVQSPVFWLYHKCKALSHLNPIFISWW